MTDEHEKPPKFPHVVFWLIVFELAALNHSIISMGRRIEARISQLSTFYLCIELKKVGGEARACDRFERKPKP